MEKNSELFCGSYDDNQQSYYPKCKACGEKGTHVCIPVVCDMLLDSDKFRDLVRTTLQEVMNKQPEPEKSPEHPGAYYGKGPIG